MRIKFWGVRGSIPVPGPQTSEYGGNSSCYELRLSDDRLIIFDAGTGIRLLGQKLAKDGPRRMHLMLSHGHMDHVHGFPFFGPAYIHKNKITVVGCAQTGRSVKDLLRRQMGDLYFPVEYDGLPATMEYMDHCGHGCDSGGCLKVGKARIFTHGINHPGGGISYKVVERGSSMVYMTDNELMSDNPDAFDFDEFVEFVEGVDVLLHDAQYTPKEYESYTKGWGHSRYTDVARLAAEAAVKKVVLIHFDPDHNDRKVAWMEKKTREEIKRLGGRSTCIAAREGKSISL